MAHDDDSASQPAQPSPAPSASTEQSPASAKDVPSAPGQPEKTDRAVLISQARAFLVSPQIQYQDVAAKRVFLREKGLNDLEIDVLLREHPPLIPPRTYPQPPPSNLPHLLVGVLRLFSWLIGGSAVGILAYQRFLLPRLILSQKARAAIRSYHLSLLRKLATSLSSLKESKAEAYSILPTPEPYTEDPKYASCHSISDLISAFVGNEKEESTAGEDLDMRDLPKLSLLRCAFEEGTKDKEEKRLTLEELLKPVEDSVPWLKSSDGVIYVNSLVEILSSCPLFQPSEGSTTSDTWKYVPTSPPPPPPLQSSLINLRTSLSSLPRKVSADPGQNPTQETFQTLFSFTGYLTSQLYSLPGIRSFRTPGAMVSNVSHPVEEDMRREIRALKGLVLNRRSFKPTTPGNTLSTDGSPGPVAVPTDNHDGTA